MSIFPIPSESTKTRFVSGSFLSGSFLSRSFLSVIFLSLLLIPMESMAEVDEDRIGAPIAVDLFSLPQPYQSPSFSEPPIYAGSRPDPTLLRVPEGFKVSIFASGLENPRNMVVDKNGTVYLTQSFPGLLTRLRDSNGDGKADETRQCQKGFSSPHGLAIHDGHLYLADMRAVWKLAKDPCVGKRQQITKRGILGSEDGHWTRNIIFHPDGKRFFVAIGSRGNIEEEAEPRATIQQFAVDGTHRGTFASGLRNPVGIVFRPGSDELWTVVNERDGMGDGLVPDYLTQVDEGAFYGWPYSYLGDNPQPSYEKEALQRNGQVRVPDLLFRSHSAPLGLVFYDHSAFGEDYRGDAFVALHGSWNAGKPRGYIVARVPFEKGRPQGWYEAFVTGFRINPGGSPARVRGRPAGLAIMPDGALLVADDFANVVWRVTRSKD